jgi:hypothetical protein
MSINRMFIGIVCEKVKLEIKNNTVKFKAFFIFIDAK